MNKIHREISIVRRRLMIQRGLRILPWAIGLSFAVCFGALLFPKIAYLPYTFRSWSSLWIAAASISSLLITVVGAIITLPSTKFAAVELDKRYGLHERVSSLLMLSKSEQDNAFASALEQDTQRELDRIDVRDQFPLRQSPKLPWVLLPILACISLFWIPDASMTQAVALSEEAKVRIENVKQQTKPILSQVKELRETLDEQGLKEATEGLKKLERRMQEMQAKKELPPKELLSDFNAIKKQLEQQKDALKSSNRLKDSLAELKNLEKGVGDKFAESLKEGDLSKSLDELNNIQKMLADGKLSDQDKEQLMKQLSQMDKALQEKLEQQKDRLESLKQELAKAESSGDIEQAASLRKQVEQAQNALEQAQRNSKISKSLADAVSALKEGDGQKAQESLEQLQEALKSMQASEEASDELEKMINDIEMAKQAANCKSCSGKGCASCSGGGKPGSSNSEKGSGGKVSKRGSSQATGNSKLQSQNAGKGKGIGTGSGFTASDQEINTNEYDSKVDVFNNNTERQYGGKVRGTNRPGMTLEEARSIIDSAAPEDPEASENIPLPRSEREQQREYFELLRNQ